MIHDLHYILSAERSDNIYIAVLFYQYIINTFYLLPFTLFLSFIPVIENRANNQHYRSENSKISPPTQIQCTVLDITLNFLRNVLNRTCVIHWTLNNKMNKNHKITNYSVSLFIFLNQFLIIILINFIESADSSVSEVGSSSAQLRDYSEIGLRLI